MKRFAIRTLALALAFAAGTASAQSYYDEGDTGYGDQYGQQDAGYYDAQDAGYYGAQDSGYYDAQDSGQYLAQAPGYYDDRGSNGYDAGRGPAYSDGREAHAAQGSAYDVARVISVDPMVQPGQPVQREVCRSEPVQTYARNDVYAQRRTSGGGAVIGAILGGVIGNTIAKDNDRGHGYHRGYGYRRGGSDDRAAATVVGAVLGGAIGSSIERNQQYGNPRYGYGNQGAGYVAQREVQRCRVVTDYQAEERVVGYRVGYEYAGRRFETVTDYHPGSEIRVRVHVTPDL